MEILDNQQANARIADAVAHMQEAFSLAREVISASPNPRVGCVLVRDNKVIGRGWHEATGLPHAEVNALKAAAADCAGATAFVTLEPCSHYGRTGPCCDALIAAGISEVMIAAVDSSPQVGGDGVARLEEAGIRVSLLTEFTAQAEGLNPGWLSRQRRDRPYVRCKLAMSLDGRTALASGDSKWITGSAARADVQLLRAQSDAVITGVQTVIADNPSLNVRTEDAANAQRNLIKKRLEHAGQPLRVVLDSKLQTPQDAQLLQLDGEVKIFTTRSAAATKSRMGNADIVAVAAKRGRVNLESVLELLTSSYGCNEVLVEAGPTLSAAFINAGLVDELIIYIAPRLLGSDGKSLLAISGLNSIEEAIQFEFKEILQLGPDIRVTAIPV